VVIYTGKETRSKMNSQHPKSKIGKVDLEINKLTKFLFILMLALAIGLTGLAGFKGNWAIQLFRYILLLSYIIPLSLRTNADLGKIIYSVGIARDKVIGGTIPRNSTIPEELGRI
jgi:phospholipid-translocating ATPase